jgi:glycosyltransferase involved in cell wall biosynthesis
MHICIVSDDYPSENNPSYIFVQQLCNAMADQGNRITIIAPQSITKAIFRSKTLKQKYSISFTDNNYKIEIYRPYFISLSNVNGFLKKVIENFRKSAIFGVISKMKSKPDICYGHFWHSGYAVYKAAKRFNLPLFVASGESEIKFHKDFSHETLSDFTKYVSGVICVSTKNKQESIKNGLTTEDKCIVLPNAFDRALFYPQNRIELRKKYGFNNNDFIVSFVGGFIHRKGAKRISDAITLLNDKEIKVIFIGGGVRQPESLPVCDGIIFQGEVPHKKIVEYLNCSDIYILPTLHEGSNNSIIEAMACGLPIISSNLSFNFDILDPAYSILIDPLYIEQIADGIKQLKNNPEIRIKMSEKALIASQNFDIKVRAKKILAFIEQKTNSN